MCIFIWEVYNRSKGNYMNKEIFNQVDPDGLNPIKIHPTRMKGLLRAAKEREKYFYWIKCELCLDLNVYETTHDKNQAHYKGCCHCGYRIPEFASHFKLNGKVPAGHVVTWDDEEL